jgi:hypothetical protein
VHRRVDRGEAEQHRAVIGGQAFHFLEHFLCAGEAGLQSFDLAEPVVLFGFGDAGVKVGDDLSKPVSLIRVGPEQRASQASVFVVAIGSVGAAAAAEGPYA